MEFPKSQEESKNNSPENPEATLAEWREFYAKYSQLQDDVHDLIFGLEKDRKRYYFEKRQEQIRRSFDSIKNPQQYLTCHLSVGGTAYRDTSPKLDYEGEYSLYTFLKKLQEEIKVEIEKNNSKS